MNWNLDPKIGHLLADAARAGNTPEAVALAENAVRAADSGEDIHGGFSARCKLMDIAVFSGFPEKVLLAFSWCLARFDQDPSRFSSVELLWKYKWVLEKVTHFPLISREKILELHKDFHRRCSKTGFTDYAALSLRWLIALELGDRESATEHFAIWKKSKRDGLADCKACEVNRVAEYYATLGQHEKALKTAQPIFDGRLRCGEIPHLTHATLLRSLWLTGQTQAAKDHHLKGYRLVRTNRQFIREQSWHLSHLLRTGELGPAAVLVRKHLPWALSTKSLDHRFYFLIPALVCVERLRASGIAALRCTLPPSDCPVARKTTVLLQGLSDWMAVCIQELARQFDQRNGNSHFSNISRDLAEELVTQKYNSE